jgi:hypothetical protein
MATLFSTGLTAATSMVDTDKEPVVPKRSAAAIEAQKQAALAGKRRGRSSTLTTPGGGLSETPTLGRASLLGAA